MLSYFLPFKKYYYFVLLFYGILNHASVAQLYRVSIFGLFTLAIMNNESICIYKHFSKCKNLKHAFGTQKAPFYGVKCNSWPHGEMDITRVFGTRFSGSNPDGATTFLDWNFSRNSSFLILFDTNLKYMCYNKFIGEIYEKLFYYSWHLRTQ